MAQTIKIKRSNTTAAPASLTAGELAFSSNSGKLFIGHPDGTSAELVIGGDLYVNLLDHTAGTLTASSAIIVDSNSKIDVLNIDNIILDGNTISTSGSPDNLTLNPTGNLDIDAGTVTFASQATEFLIIDNSSTALTITEGTNNYLTFDTTNSGEQILFNKQISLGLDGTTGYTLPTADGTAGYALVTNGSGAVTFQEVSSTLDIAADTNLESPDATQVALLTQTLSILGTSAQGVSTSANGPSITITVADATTSAKGVASYDSTDFSVSSGVVSVAATTLGSSSLNPGATTLSLAGLESLAVDNITIDGNDISSTNTNGDITLSPNGTGVVKVASGYSERAGFDDNTLVPKTYVDSVLQGLDVKESVSVATTGNLTSTYDNNAGTITNSGSNAAIQIDNRTLSANARVLVKDQSAGAQNGIYEVTTVGDGSTPWVLTRASDADVSSKLTGGTFVFVEDGDTNADNGYVFTHNGTPTLGTTDLTVTQFSGAGQVTAGNGLTKTGNTLDVGGSNTITANADTIQIKGINDTALGELLIGAASGSGFTALAAPTLGAASSPVTTVTASEYLLSIDLSGNPTWGNVLDGGTF